MVGKGSYLSAWAAWETQKAVTLKKKLVAVKTDSVNNSPPAVQRAGASWSILCHVDSIKKGRWPASSRQLAPIVTEIGVLIPSREFFSIVL